MFNMTLLYMNRNIPLQAKILFGYMMLIAVIISMAAILFHEHARLRKIEADTYEIRQARRDISEIHRNIDRKSTRLNSSHPSRSRMPSSA